MYVKAYKKEGYWYREDTNAPLGHDIGALDGQLILLHEQKKNVLTYGYINSFGEFTAFCTGTICSCDRANHGCCRHNPENIKTSGFYISVDT